VLARSRSLPRTETAALFTGPFARVTIANFFFFLNFASFFLLPLYVKALGGSETTVGVVMGTGGTATLLTLPLIAVMIDRVGRRRFLVLGTIGMTAASACYLWVDAIGPSLFAVRVLQGASFAAAFTATTAFAAAFAPPDRRAQALGIFGLSVLLTHAVAPAAGEEIIRRLGFQALFAVTIGWTLMALLLAIRLPPGVAVPSAGPQPAAWHFDRLQWVVAATMVLSGMGFGAMMTFTPTFVHGEGLGRVGIFFAAYTTTAILTRFMGAGLSDSFGRRAVIVPTLLILAGSIATMALVHSLPVLVCAGALFGSAQGISYPTLHAFLVDLTAEAHLGRAQALFNGSFNFGVTSSAFIFGVAAEQFGYRPMFALASLTPLTACVLFYRYGAATRTGRSRH
jgi:MFS family permease